MNISYNWLKDLIEIDLSPAEVGEKLTRVGLAVEGIHPHGDDFVFDIDLTSNRPDCLSHLGVARELSAITEKPLNAAASSVDSVPLPSMLADEIVTVGDGELCQRFTARIIKGVKIGPSPQWLVDRLEAIGERSINNVADITNYVMHELGQPMHSFDLDKLAGNRIVVRRARIGETIRTLDDTERTLNESMLAICDAERPAAVAGIMGGLDSSITDQTTNVLLEVAYFKRENIRATSRSLKLATEASYRFERGVDIENLITASNRATQLICELAGGSAGDLIDVYPNAARAETLRSRDIADAVKRLTGIEATTEKCLTILSDLGISSSEPDVDGTITFASPSWRHDIAIEEDLVEEIARHIGYENIAEELPPAYGAGEYQISEARLKSLRQALVNSGYDEAISYSFIDTRHDGIFETVPSISSSDLVTLRDSVIDGAVRMRPTLLPGLLAAVRLNFNQQHKDVRLFEIGKAFSSADGFDEPPTEQELLSIVMTGGSVEQGRELPVRELDLYDIKGSVELALEAAGVTGVSFGPGDVRHLRKGQSANIVADGETIGYFGRLADDVAAPYKFRQPVFVAEVDLQSVLRMSSASPVYRPLPKFPGVSRDVSFLVKRNFNFADLAGSLESEIKGLFQGVGFVDLYEGKGLAADERSLTVRLKYRSDDRTLVESEVDALHQEIMAKLEQKLGIRPRF